MGRLSGILSRASASGTVHFDLWRQHDWCNQNVAGESHYADALRGMFPARLPENAAIDTVADLVPEPGNRHDPNAVLVRVGGKPVGHLPKEDAARYQPMLLELVARSRQPRVGCTIRGSEWPDVTYDDRGRGTETVQFHCDVRVALDEPHLCVPINAPPSVRHLLLPQGNAIQVAGEENHLDAIAPFLTAEGAAWTYATAHSITDSTKAAREVIEVRLDGRRVGQLTPKMSGEILPAVRHLDTNGITAAVRTMVRGNRLKSEVTLYVVRAHELPADWPGEIGEMDSTAANIAPAGQQPSADIPPLKAPTGNAFIHRSIPPKPVLVRYNPPPAWPSAPAGWEPWTGWQPPQDWPPAPDGWHYWVGDSTEVSPL